jgi:hypothetical protein
MQYNKSSKQTEIFLLFWLLIDRFGIQTRFAYLFQKEFSCKNADFFDTIKPNTIYLQLRKKHYDTAY